MAVKIMLHAHEPINVKIKNLIGFILKIPAGIETSSLIPGISLPIITDLSPYFSNQLSAFLRLDSFIFTYFRYLYSPVLPNFSAIKYITKAPEVAPRQPPTTTPAADRCRSHCSGRRCVTRGFRRTSHDGVSTR